MDQSKPDLKKSATKLDQLRAFYDAEDYAKAEKIALQLLKSKKNAPVAAYALGLIKYHTKDFAIALSYFEKALILDAGGERTGYIYFWIGQTQSYNDFLAEVKNPVHSLEKAKAAYRKALDHVDYPPETIDKLVDNGTPEWEKIVLYNRGIRDFPDTPLFYIRCSWVHRRENSPIKQLEMLQKGLERSPKSAGILFSLTQYHYNSEQYSISNNYILSAIEQSKGENLDCFYYMVGSISFAQGHYAEAVSQFQKSIEVIGQHSDVWYPVCGILAACHRLGITRQAEPYFVKQVLDRKIFQYIEFRFGIVAWSEGERIGESGLMQPKEDLIKPLTELHRSSKDQDFKIKSAIVLAALCDHFDLVADRHKHLRFAITNSNEVSYLSSSLTESYHAFLKTEFNVKEIIKEFQDDSRRVLTDTQTKSILYAFVQQLHSLKNYDSVWRLCEGFEESAIIGSNVLFQYAYALKEAKQSNLAKYYYEKEIELYPESSASLNNLGVIYREEGDLDKALTLFQDALKLEQSKDLYKRNVQQTIELLADKTRKDKAEQIPSYWKDTGKNITVERLEELDYFEVLRRIDRVSAKYNPLLRRDWQELVFNYCVRNYKSTVILSGSFVELLLTYYCEKKRMKTVPIKGASGQITSKKLYDCVLNDLISYVTDQRLFGNDFNHLGNLARVYRNYIHPGLELKGDGNIKPKAELCFISAKEILTKIL